MHLPQNFNEWRTCIEVHCGIPLTPEFIAQRLRELEDRRLHSTEQLYRHYGDAHMTRICSWFQQAADGLGMAR